MYTMNPLLRGQPDKKPTPLERFLSLMREQRYHMATFLKRGPTV